MSAQATGNSNGVENALTELKSKTEELNRRSNVLERELLRVGTFWSGLDCLYFLLLILIYEY